LESISPIHKAEKIKAPLMVIHGKNDPRVPVGEAEQIVDKVRGNGGAVEYLLYDDEGHGLAKLKNRLDAYPRIAAFLDLYLAGEQS
jgi:dipeptidyl aminopeptidase/acylaminoacyl peptidase